jgi:hypothetical protein
MSSTVADFALETPDRICGSRSTNRRTRAAMQVIREAIYEILREIQPATVRQTFYQLVSRGVIAKTEGEYKQTVVRLLTAMRRAGEIPFGSSACWIGGTGAEGQKLSLGARSRRDLAHQIY